MIATQQNTKAVAARAKSNHRCAGASLLVLAMRQAILPPQYHPSYAAEGNKKRGSKESALRKARKDKLHAISLKLGKDLHANIFAVMRETDPKLNKDDCRKMLDELCAAQRMDKQAVYDGGKKVFYTARPEPTAAKPKKPSNPLKTNRSQP